MRKHIVKLLCFWIPGKARRRKIKENLMNFRFVQDITGLLRLSFKRLKKPTVLVVESNDTHGEVVVGYAKYFRDLGYDVDVLLNQAVAEERPFCRVEDGGLKIYCLSNVGMRILGKLGLLNKYDRIMITSSVCYFYPIGNENRSARKLLGSVPEEKLFVVEHDISDIDVYDERKLLAGKRLVTLVSFPKTKTMAINPHYFGDVNKTAKNEVANFVVVGGIEAKRKNHKLLTEAVKGLASLYAGKFRITVVGKGKLEDIPEDIRGYVEIKGRLNFPDMYTEMEKADFYLPLLDPENEAHKRYITTGATGSFQLMLGFAKLGIIHKEFANFYGLSNNNAVIYEGNSLKDAMAAAITMDGKEYLRRQKNLDMMADEIYNASLSVLKEII